MQEKVLSISKLSPPIAMEGSRYHERYEKKKKKERLANWTINKQKQLNFLFCFINRKYHNSVRTQVEIIFDPNYLVCTLFEK